MGEANITKKIIYPGSGNELEFTPGSKATFHFKTFTLSKDKERKEIDCSKKVGQPFELLIGKQFKLVVWEELVRTMKVGEISEFVVDSSLVESYPFVSKSLRDHAAQQKGHHHAHDHDHKKQGKHHCSMAAFQDQGTGYKDLDELVKEKPDLVFQMHLEKFEKSGEYKKEAWQMDDKEKLAILPKYKEEGNHFYKEKKYTDAALKYSEALGCLEQLCLREKPKDEAWNELNEKKLPFLLNYAQCKLLLGEYYEVIRHTTTVLDSIDPNNVKALYRRAKAHVGCWDPKEARQDFERVMELDQSLVKTVRKELEELDRKEKEHNEEYKEKLKGIFS
ncbi:AH receptor-interacting [Paramuricea clavata]|uniref:AH receptor-interacting n=1 Tax=Paramuricea clavata TaxID=317549 RepID=A0A7D9ER18_PARCT|nr:AH receptor-interacting [Paramuricea clavata]